MQCIIYMYMHRYFCAIQFRVVTSYAKWLRLRRQCRQLLIHVSQFTARSRAFTKVRCLYRYIAILKFLGLNLNIPIKMGARDAVYAWRICIVLNFLALCT